MKYAVAFVVVPAAAFFAMAGMARLMFWLVLGS